MRIRLFFLTTIACSLLFFSGTASAAVFTVTSTGDTGANTLRDAITQSNAAAAGGNTIDITATGTIDLASALPTITNAVSIAGPGAASLNVHRNGAAASFSVFTVGAAVEITGITISNGAGPVGIPAGGGVTVSSGSFTLTESVVSGCTTLVGGAAIYTNNNSPLTVQRSVLSGNTVSTGGAVFGGDTTTITETTISGNTGTAIWFSTASKVLTLDRSTVSGNAGGGSIGGLAVQGGTANVTSSTFSGNTGAQGGDFWTYSAGVTLTLLNVTSEGASTPALLLDRPATVTARNTIFSGTGARCAIGGGGALTSQGHNLSTDATCALAGAGDQQNANAMLGALASNGGPTQTHLPLAGSLAINYGDDNAAPATDQRGSPRLSGGTVDIGAVEGQVPGAPTIGVATPGDGQVTIAFTAPASNGDGSITAYGATCIPGNVSGTSATSPITVMGLTNDMLFRCAVTAGNAYGSSPESGTVDVTPVAIVDAGADAEADAAATDAGEDAAIADAAPVDAAAETGTPSPAPDSGAPSTFDGGLLNINVPPAPSDDCDCHVAGVPVDATWHLAAFAGSIGMLLVRRRKQRERRDR